MAERMAPGSPPEPGGGRASGRAAGRRGRGKGTRGGAGQPGERASGEEAGGRRGGKRERKAVLNVTVSESLAEEVRRAAALEHSTISSVVEKALAEQIGWEIRRQEGLAAIDAYYRELGYPAPEERARAAAQVAEEERLIEEARAEMGPEGWKPPAWYLEASWPGWWGAE